MLRGLELAVGNRRWPEYVAARFGAQRACGDTLELQLAHRRRELAPHGNRGLLDAERSAEAGLRAEKLDGVVGSHAMNIDVSIRRVNRHVDTRLSHTARMSIAERVQSLRKNAKLTQKQLANRVGIKQPSLSAIETGDTLEISGTVLLALARELRANPEWILYGRGNPHGSVELSADEKEMLDAWRALGTDSRSAVLQMARLLQPKTPAILATPAPTSPDHKPPRKH